MRENVGRSWWRYGMWGTAGVLLLVPLIAMQFTPEVHWTPLDFIMMGTLLAAACGAVEIGAGLSQNTAFRLGVALGVLAALLMMWVNLAVGIIGSEENDANWMFVGVLALGLAGAAIARFRAAGLKRTLRATAVAQLAVCAIALVGNMGTDGRIWPRDLIGRQGSSHYCGWRRPGCSAGRRESRRAEAARPNPRFRGPDKLI